MNPGHMLAKAAPSGTKKRKVPHHMLQWGCQALLACWMLWGAQAEDVTEEASQKGLWSLSPVVAPVIPQGGDSFHHPIDRFLSEHRQEMGLKAVGSADKLTLLRRIYLDLVGLTPSPAQQDAFLEDPSPEAYEKVVHQLLESEQHAVRYARHWLDVMRYADADAGMMAAPGIHLWRDWVIGALNEDLPYDDFVQIQLTGRRARERTRMSATGYRSEKEPRPGDMFALGLLSRGAGNHLAINAVDTVSSAFMGMTVACAKCHDHMFDPISQEDYYSMKALFDPLVPRKVTLASAQTLLEAGKVMAELQKARAPLEKELEALLAPFRQRLYDERVEMLPPDVRTVILKPEKIRSLEEQKIADDYFPILRIDSGKINEILPEEVRAQSQALKKRLDEVSKKHPTPPSIPVFHTLEKDPIREGEPSYILTSADPNRPELNRAVKPGWPFADGPMDIREGRIEAFADWLTASKNPLFARVAVNRLWQWHFGSGLHKQPSDFGTQSPLPLHRDLLDWLASEFISSGYSMKYMHRLMVTSKAYQMASDAGPEFTQSHAIDPNNDHYWRFPLNRLEAEVIWDAIHLAADNLDLSIGGPSFTPGDASTPRRRGVYITRGYSPSRNVTPDFLQAFDVDDGREPCPVRTQTVTAPQSLFLMNSPEVEQASSQFAHRLRKLAEGDLGKAVILAYRLTLARPPTDSEARVAMEYLEGDFERLQHLAWLLFNLDEFIYVR